jgi:hypothetical protein
MNDERRKRLQEIRDALDALHTDLETFASEEHGPFESMALGSALANLDEALSDIVAAGL